ncbi:MAG: ABC transporter permease [Candidatus Omnitrophica bacterium]|nr:ABC transporter permease [Candidatus Omnitrophota bacterium]
MKPIIYEPTKYLKLGIKIWPEMFSELIQSRELMWRLFMRDVFAKYKQSLFGYFWVLLLPFITIGTFIFLNRTGVLNISSTDVPYPLFALMGLTVWQLFSVGVVSGTNSIVSAGSMIVKINFPLEVLVFSSMAQTLFEFLIKFCLLIIFFFVFKFVPSWGILFFPLAVIPILILTVALSLILSLVNGVVRDTANAVALLATFLMFLNPVLYPLSPDKSILFRLNPLAPLINAPRDLIVYGYIQEPVDFFIASALSVLLFFVMWRVFHLVETKIPERL